MTDFVAHCEQCGVIETGGLEEVGDAAEDHEQFHDVRVKRVATDGGQPVERTLEDAAEPAIVGSCEACDGRLIEHVVAHHDDTGSVQLVCEDCDAEVRIEYEIGAENPWEKATDIDGVTDATVKDVAWVDCDRCHGHGRVEDPLCDLRRAMNGREHPCPDCSASGKVPRVVETDGGHDQDDDEFFVVDEHRGAVVAGPFESKETAAEEALDRGPSHIVATQAVLEMIALTSSTTIRWENEETDALTDGGRDRLTPADRLREAVKQIRIAREELGHGPHPAQDAQLARSEYAIRGVADALEEHEDEDQDDDVDPSLLTDGGHVPGPSPDPVHPAPDPETEAGVRDFVCPGCDTAFHGQPEFIVEETWSLYCSRECFVQEEQYLRGQLHFCDICSQEFRSIQRLAHHDCGLQPPLLTDGGEDVDEWTVRQRGIDGNAPRGQTTLDGGVQKPRGDRDDE